MSMHFTSTSRTAFVVGLAALVAGCLGQVAPDGSGPVGVTARDGVGEPCVPTIEDDPSFTGFDEQEVAVETGSSACGTGVCLVNHFRGRVSCPYGEASPHGCRTPRGARVDGDGFASVRAQCADRRAASAVHCSCRCANGDGRTDDGDTYCACGAGFVCAPLFATFPGSEKLAGSYCVREETEPRACRRSCSASDPDALCEP